MLFIKHAWNQVFDDFVPDFLKKMKFNISDKTLKSFSKMILGFWKKDAISRLNLRKNTNLVVLYHGLCSKNPEINIVVRSLLENIA